MLFHKGAWEASPSRNGNSLFENCAIIYYGQAQLQKRVFSIKRFCFYLTEILRYISVLHVLFVQKKRSVFSKASRYPEDELNASITLTYETTWSLSHNKIKINLQQEEHWDTCNLFIQFIEPNLIIILSIVMLEISQIFERVMVSGECFPDKCDAWNISLVQQSFPPINCIIMINLPISKPFVHNEWILKRYRRQGRLSLNIYWFPLNKFNSYLLTIS